MRKRILGVWLAVCIVASLIASLPVTANAETRKQCGNMAYWTFANGILTISGSGELWDDYMSQYLWYDAKDSINEVIIEDGVTGIGQRLFASHNNLISITIPDSVTSIEEDAFYNTGYYNDDKNWENGVLYIGKHLIKADKRINGNYTVKAGTICIGDSAFYECENLSSIIISDGVYSIGDVAFYGCKNLTNITIPDSVTSIENGAFFCSGYRNDETNWESGILYIGKWLIDAEYSRTHFEVKSGTKHIADRAFSGVTSLTSVIIPSGVVSIGDNAFNGCGSIENINLPDSITYIGADAFIWCKSLKNIIIPEGVDCIKRAFLGCSSLSSITIPKSVVKISDDSFEMCPALSNISVSPQNNAYSSLNGSLYNKNKTLLCKYAAGKNEKNFEIPNTVTSIGRSAFDNSPNLEKITIPNSVTTIGNYAFSECDSLTEIYYNGTQEQWEKIKIGNYGNDSISSIIHYNSIPANGNILQTIKVNGNTVTVGVKNISDTNYNSAVLLVGVYNGSDSLCDVKTVTIKDFVSGYTDSNINVTFDSIPKDSCVKAFLWKSMDTMEPICSGRKINV